ncbi:MULTISPECIES: hypothetical protein [unclassified Streptomyces]|uniref:hypothetical protein n=1 Tax=unclassified Streptomyces TaxID=2593676 RepID=UPI00081B2097|nr:MULTISPECIES: hypothetical protein [unclassified Streptomyces]MYQ89606.1 hypothetical protein [Streptomyces sp. SID4936]SCE59012.1 hypothetical protein GA0115234_11478 [Streptomyces sp. DvalAA-43]
MDLVAAPIDRIPELFDQPLLFQSAEHLLADDAFIHAMHGTAVWTMVIAPIGAALLVFALRPDGHQPRVEVPGERLESAVP